MSPDTSEVSRAARGRLVGFLSLGALIALVAVAFFAARAPSGGPQPPAGASSAAPEASPAAPQAPAAPPPAGPSPVSPGPGAVISAQIEDIALSPQARLLAERFKCVCGCEDPLSICVCQKTPGSRDMKTYLQELVTAGKTPSEIESAMVARYGDKVLP